MDAHSLLFGVTTNSSINAYLCTMLLTADSFDVAVNSPVKSQRIRDKRGSSTMVLTAGNGGTSGIQYPCRSACAYLSVSVQWQEQTSLPGCRKMRGISEKSRPGEDADRGGDGEDDAEGSGMKKM